MTIHDANKIALNDLFSRSSWRNKLTAMQIKRIDGETIVRTFAPGVIVCHKSVPANHWIGVAKGLLKVDTISTNGKETTFQSFSSGAWLGEGTILKGELRNYSIGAIRESTVAFIPAETFLWLIESNPLFSRWVIDHLNARLGYFVALVEGLRLGNVTARVAYCLTQICICDANSSLFQGVQISQLEIARLTGLSRQRVNRALNELESAGHIHVGYTTIDVLDFNGLQAAATTN